MTRERFIKTYKCYSVTRFPARRGTKEQLKEWLKDILRAISCVVIGVLAMFALCAVLGWIATDAPLIIALAFLALPVIGVVGAIAEGAKALSAGINHK